MIFLVFVANAQIDTVSKEKIKEQEKFHSPKTATLLAIVPGAGQAYNRKYWKMPIVYATMGTCIYFAISNQQQFSRFKKAYMQRDNGEHDEFYGMLSKEALMNNMDRNRKDDLSAYFYPQTFNSIYTKTPIFGVGCTLNF